MRNVLLVIRHEVKSMLSKPSFWLTTFLLPGVIIALSFGSQLLARSSIADDGSASFISEGAPADLPLGYVDEAGLIKEVPDQPPAGVEWKALRLRAYPDRAAAEAALAEGRIGKYYLITRDYIRTGELIVVDSRFSIFNSLENNEWMEYVLQWNLTSDANLARLLMDPTPKLGEFGLAPTAPVQADELAAFGVPFAALFIFFFVLTMTSGYMLQSVSREKENRTIEVLLVSLRPRDLMLGKILGLGIVALLQVSIWAGGGLLVLNRGAIQGVSSLPDGFLFWGLLYFVGGYLLYSSILGGIGALAPTSREGAQYTFIVLLPMMIVVWASNALIEAPNGPTALFMSLFPLTSPIAMVTRLASVPVPIEQLLLGLALLVVTTYGIIALSSKFFRADTLLSMSSLNVRRIIQELRR